MTRNPGEFGVSIARLGALLAAVVLSACSGHSSPGSMSATTPPPTTVSSVTIAGGDLTLAPATIGTLTAQALDQSGNPINLAITWSSSDTAIATVSDGTVTAVSLGQAQITASASGVTSAPTMVLVNPSQSTNSAVAAAVAAGKITAEQGLVYQVFGIFGDSRLPAEYRGTSDQPATQYDLTLLTAANQFDSLSPDSQDMIGPYLIPPAYWQSAASAPARVSVKSVGRPSSVRPDYCGGAIGANWVSNDTPHFRVWYDKKNHPDQATMATNIGTYAEMAYTALVLDSGFNAPLADSSWICDGGDARLDIYITPLTGLTGVTTPLGNINSGAPSATFIAISSTVSGNELALTTAHEFMHAIQDSYPHMGLPSFWWTLDASAVWAESVVFPQSFNPYGFPAGFVSYIDKPLFFPDAYCSDSSSNCGGDASADFKMYGSYMFFTFMVKQLGNNSAVSQFFANAALASDPLPELDYVLLLTGQGGLTKQWPQFVLDVWNQDPVSTFPEWDGAQVWGDQLSFEDLGINAPPSVFLTPSQGSATNSVKVDELSAVFNQYYFSDSLHSVVFYNGFSVRLDVQNTAVSTNVTANSSQNLSLGNAFVMFDPTQDEVQGRHITALLQVGDIWLPPQDWTQMAYVPLCLDQANQRVQRLVLIFSNGNFTTSRSDDFDDNAIDSLNVNQKSTLVASSTRCWKYQGTTNNTLSYDDGTDKFTVTASTTITYNGQPTFAQGNDNGQTATVFRGWIFQPDPNATSVTFTAVGTINSCAPGTQVNETDSAGAEYFSNMPSLFSWFPLVTSSGYKAYSSAGDTPVQYFVGGCGGGKTKTLPAVGAIDLNGDFSAFHTLDDIGRMSSGAGGIPTPVWNAGDYPGVSTYNASWCLAPMREGVTATQPTCP